MPCGDGILYVIKRNLEMQLTLAIVHL